MTSHELLLSEIDLWAIPQNCVDRISRLEDWREPTAPLALSTLGLKSREPTGAARVLHLILPGRRISLEIQGTLSSVVVDSQRVHHLPPAFFARSPASALVVLETGRAAILLDPGKFGA